jgi:hypothetical protein
MTRVLAAATVLALVLGLAIGTGLAQQSFGSPAPERFFRVEAEGGERRGGRPAVRGYVYNSGSHAASRVQLLIEALDASGQVTGKTLAHIDELVPPFNRAYFDVAVPAKAPSYRVSVYYYEWLKGGGAGARLFRH